MAEILILMQMNSRLDRCGGAGAVEVEAGRMTESLGDACLRFRSQCKVSKVL